MNAKIVLAAVAVAMMSSLAQAEDAPAANLSAMVQPAGPGVFAMHPQGPARFQLVVTGRNFPARDAVEKYLAFRAAQLTQEKGFQWFTLVERHAKGDKAPAPATDPGMVYSFRMAFWRPVWRYQTSAAPGQWKSWSPFSGAPFWADGMDPKSVTSFEVSADIVLHKGEVQGRNPLAFEAGALFDFLVNQVEPPQ